MNEIKYLHLLDGIVDQDAIKLMEMAAKEHRKYSAITFKILKANEKAVTIDITQSRSAAGNHQTQKRLIEIVHETFGRFFPGRKLLVHATPYREPAVNVVTVAWIANKMSKLKVRVTDISNDTGLSYTSVSEITSGATPLSQQMKALLYYYFKCKE